CARSHGYYGGTMDYW
nr:immunoglobulin heavy chain junction region [Mus musculus]